MERYWKEIRAQHKTADVPILLKKKTTPKTSWAMKAEPVTDVGLGASCCSPTFSQSVEPSGDAGNSVSSVRDVQLL